MDKAYNLPTADKWQYVLGETQLRRTNQSPLLTQLETQKRYENTIRFPVPGKTSEPNASDLSPQVIREAIENTALRSNMSTPSIIVPSLEVGKSTGTRSDEYAAIRRNALYASWYKNDMQLLLGRGYRQLAAYGTFAMVVVPCFEGDYGYSKVELRDPLGCYPDPRSDDQMDPPQNVVFVYGRSTAWIKNKYPEAREYLNAGIETMNRVTGNPNELLWDLIEWMDGEETIIGIAGIRDPSNTQIVSTGGGFPLRSYPNPTGMVCAAVPRRVTLSRIAGQVEHLHGITDWMARLSALEVAAAERGVYPDVVVLADERMDPQIMTPDGEWQDGRTGKPNILAGVKQVSLLQSGPGPMTQRVIDSLEETTRMSGHANALLSGRNTHGLRTGRAIDTMAGFSVDPHIAELQNIMALSLGKAINPAIIETEKAYWPKHKYVVFSGWPGTYNTTEYVPEKHFETTQNAVVYAMPGTDIAQASVILNQMTATELMSRRTAQTKHPLIDDAEAEERQIAVERWGQTLTMSAMQKAAEGVLTFDEQARIIELLEEGYPQHKAVMMAHKEAQELQATQAPPAPEGMAVPPETMPGLNAPGMGAEMQPPPVTPEPNQSLQNGAQIVNALRLGLPNFASERR